MDGNYLGNYVEFCSFPQTSSGTDDTLIEWLVLVCDGDNALFLYTDEALLRSLEYTNYFVERFVEENLPKWMLNIDLSEENS